MRHRSRWHFGSLPSCFHSAVKQVLVVAYIALLLDSAFFSATHPVSLASESHTCCLYRTRLLSGFSTRCSKSHAQWEEAFALGFIQAQASWFSSAFTLPCRFISAVTSSPCLLYLRSVITCEIQFNWLIPPGFTAFPSLRLFSLLPSVQPFSPGAH